MSMRPPKTAAGSSCISFAAHSARMMAMAATRTDVDAKLEALSRRERKLRQDEIIAELMELTAGIELSAVRSPHGWVA
jgi:F0F1-type ATP synthase gamma subunit